MVLVAFVCTNTISAQTSLPQGRFGNGGTKVQMPYKTPSPSVKGIEATENQLWFGYWNTEELASLGVEAPIDHNLAVYVPAGLTKTTAAIQAVRFMLMADNVDNMYVWVSTKLPQTPQDADLAVKAVSNYEAGKVTDQALDKPVTIPAEGVFVGVAFDVTKVVSEGDYYPIVISMADEPIANSFLYQIGRDDDPSWWDDSSYGYQLAISALIEGDFCTNAASVKPFPISYVTKGGKTTVPVQVVNYGKNSLENISYTITTGNDTSEEQTIKLKNPVSGLAKSTQIEFTFPAGENAEAQTRTLTITKVNGEPNEASAKQTDGIVATIDKPVQNVPVMEEFTGMWCGWCPRGAVGMEMMKEKYGDRIVTIAVHSDDILDIGKYYSGNISGYPSATINRGAETDPYYGIEYAIMQEMNAICPVSLSLKASWANEANDQIKVEATSAFRFNMTGDVPYGIAYALVEDGMTGKGRNWYQANYFAGQDADYSDDPNLLPLCSKGSYISDMVYDHVAVDCWDSQYGIEGSVKAPIRLGEAQAHSFVADISDNDVYINKENMTLVAMLIDHTSGKILNAAQVKISEYDPTAIESVKADNCVEIGRYTLDGRMTKKNTKGLVISRMSDGTVRKIFVK